MPVRHRHQAIDRRVGIAAQLGSHRVRGRVVIDLGGQVLAACQVLEAKQTVPVTGAAATRIVLHHLRQAPT